MNRRSLALLSCLPLLVFAACSRPAQNDPAVSPTTATTSDGPASAGVATKEIVRASAAPVTLRAGGETAVEVRLTIADGYHVNANPPTYPYLKATVIEVAPDEAVSAGQPTYPPSRTQKFAFAEEPLAVYDGEVSITVPLRAAKDGRAGGRSLRAKVRVQACDQEKCYPPTSLDAALPVTIN